MSKDQEKNNLNKKNAEVKVNKNPLGYLPEGELLRKFAIPSIIAMLVTSFYNIVDQFFIGRSVGELGNAATNITFPFSIMCLSLALLFGIGGASAFNLSMGAGQSERAGKIIGNSIVGMAGCGIIISIIVFLFTDKLLIFFGSPAGEVLEYGHTYAIFTAIGFPMLLISAGGGHILRADGSPKMTMLVNISGAVINIILDALFIFGFGWGMAGAALATVIGQTVAAAIVLWYLTVFKTVKLKWSDFKLEKKTFFYLVSLGGAPCFNQLSMMAVQIVLNNSLKHYGGMSVYGESIPIACAGIITKVSQLFFSFIIGISQGLQPIVSYNYGAQNYKRVKKAYLMAIGVGSIISVFSFIMFQIFPRQIISIFGEGSPSYFEFGEKYFRIFLFFICVCFMQPISSNFFTSIGKPSKGIFLSLTRQIIFLLPLLIILPIFMGIDGIMYAGPLADFTAFLTCTILIILEFKNLNKKIAQIQV